MTILTTNNQSLKVAIILAMTIALGPFSLDTYLPAFPVIAASLQVSVHQVSLTISVYIFVLAVGQLCGGSLSDHFGRSKIMLFGMGIFAVASFLLVFAENLSEFLILRMLQAFGGGCAAVTVPALIRDRISGSEAAKFFSLIGLLMVLAPALAPNIGALILNFIDWHYIFIFLGVYALSVIVLLKTYVFRNEVKVLQQEKVNVWERYKQVMSNRSAMRLMFIGSLTFSVLMLFITHASFIYQQHFGVSPQLFSILFSSNVVLMLLMNIANRKLLNHFTPEVILRWSLGLQACALVLLLLVTLLYPQLWFFMAAVVLTIGFMGAISPNIQACYMEYFSTNTGTAAALKGATQFSLAGLISAASTLLPESILSIVLAQALCLSIALILLWAKPNR